MSEQTSSKIHLPTWGCGATQLFSVLQELSKQTGSEKVDVSTRKFFCEKK
jgi:hypothetical protein